MLRTFSSLLLLCAAPVGAQTDLLPNGPSPDKKAPAASGSLFLTARESAERDLKEAQAELGTLRLQISEEKAKRNEVLTQKEAELARLQEEAEPLAKKIDEAELEIANLTKAIERRKLEDTVLSSNLDEFVRNFETRFHQSEAPVQLPAVEKAKAASEDSSISLADKYAAQIAVVEASAARLGELLGGFRYSGKAVNDKGILTDGTFALLGPVCYFAAGDGKTAGFAMPQAGSPNAIIRNTTPAMDATILALANTGSGQAPVDPTLGSALRQFIEKESLIHTFKAGGPIMWPILAVAILMATVVVNRIIFILLERTRRRPKDVAAILAAAEAGNFDKAIEIGRKTKDFVARALGYALDHVETSVSDALSLAANLELKRFKWGFMVLETSIAAAPLLGLLGTVTGMMTSFKNVTGDLGSTSAITGGIAEALIATAAGIAIAVAGMWPYNYLNNCMENAEHELEVGASRLELIVQKHEAELRQRNVAREMQDLTATPAAPPLTSPA